MRIKLLGPVAALSLVAIVGGCGSSKAKTSTPSAARDERHTRGDRHDRYDGGPYHRRRGRQHNHDARRCQETGDAIALSDALGYDLTNDDAAYQANSRRRNGRPSRRERPRRARRRCRAIFQALAKCAHETIVTNFVTVLPGLLGVTEDQAACVGQAYITIYTDNRKAAEQGAEDFSEADPDVQSYIRTSWRLPAGGQGRRVPESAGGLTVHGSSARRRVPRR
jgi:hypothetical protein